MKFALVVLLGLALQSQATASINSALEILKLPVENRRSVALEKGSEVYSEFVKVAFSEDQAMNIRWRALMAASESQGVKSTADLLKAGKMQEWFMRNAALVALSEVNPPEAVKLAQKLVKDKALVVRSAAVLVLENNSSEQIRELLWDELSQNYNFKNKESLWIRHQIAEVLAKKALPRELKQFADMLSEKDLRLQRSAIQGLEKITGIKLGGADTPPSKLVGLWRNHLKKDSVGL
jgi:HEAT repeat protein